MKPYLYILSVLLVGGSIGFFIGRESVVQTPSAPTAPATASLDTEAIHRIFERQKEAYTFHDALLLLRDCATSYVEVDANSGRSYGLAAALIHYHEQFRPEKSVRFELEEPEVELSDNAAVVRSRYVKTSEMYVDQGHKSVVGQGLWLLTKNGGTWRVTVFFRTESREP